MENALQSFASGRSWGPPEQVPTVKNLGISFWVFQISAPILKLIRDSLLKTILMLQMTSRVCREVLDHE